MGPQILWTTIIQQPFWAILFRLKLDVITIIIRANTYIWNEC